MFHMSQTPYYNYPSSNDYIRSQTGIINLYIISPIKIQKAR